MGSATVADAGVSYRALLASNRDLANRTGEALRMAHEQRGLMLQGRQLCSVLQPRFISRAESAKVAASAACIAGVLERAGNALLASDALLDEVGASEQEREIWSAEPGYRGFTVTSRLDAFQTGDQLHFIEYNAESPAGIGFCDSLTEMFGALPAMREWCGDTRLEAADARGCLLDALLDAYREWGGTGTPRVAIIDWENVLTKRDFELCCEYFREAGVWSTIADPRRLQYRHGEVWLGEERITLIYRRVLLHELLDRADEAAPLLRAYRDGAICMVNSPRSKLLHKKTVLALLSAGAIELDLTEEEQQTIDGTIPWTRILRSGRTPYQGREVDLYPLLIEGQQNFALKPADDYGGRGVVLGWDTPPDRWKRTVESAEEGRFIVQERVDVPQVEFPVWRDGDLELVPLWMDTNPLLFRGEMGCILTRLSGSALLNVTAGAGSTTATFVVDEEGR